MYFLSAEVHAFLASRPSWGERSVDCSSPSRGAANPSGLPARRGRSVQDSDSGCRLGRRGMTIAGRIGGGTGPRLSATLTPAGTLTGAPSDAGDAHGSACAGVMAAAIAATRRRGPPPARPRRGRGRGGGTGGPGRAAPHGGGGGGRAGGGWGGARGGGA